MYVAKGGRNMKMDFILSSTTEYAMKLALLDVIKKSEQDKF